MNNLPITFACSISVRADVISALASTYFHDGSDWGSSGTCTGVVVYDDVPARNLVLGLYDRLAEQFNHDLEFAFEWWKCKYLRDPDIAIQAAEAATKADLILVSFSRLTEIPLEVKAWIERWLHGREPSPGALVVVQGSEEANGETGLQDSYLRRVAKRGHLDYLSLPGTESGIEHSDLRPEYLVQPSPAVFDSSVIRQFHSSGYGINE